MSAPTIAVGRNRLAWRSYLVLGFVLVIAVGGAFPHRLLFVFPLAASLTLPGIARPVQLAGLAISVTALAVGLLEWVGFA